MPTDEEIGKKIVEAVWMNEKHSNIFFASLQKQLDRLNTKTTKETTKLYNKILSSLDLKDKLVENSVDNLSKVSKLMLGIDKIQRVYRKKYGKIIKIAREGSWELLKTREDKITKLLNKVDIVEKSRTVVTKENKALIEMLNQQGYKRINQTLEKWKNFAYDMFYVGITRGMMVEDFKSLFYTDVGTLKIGSALAQEVEMETMISITEQRTAFLQQRAKELGYKYCWNSNPMDMRTKPECIGACLSGVITEAEMGSVHGFPPRHICRCELCYTRGEWGGVNRGINGAIASRRLHLLDELKSAPNQMSAWMRLGKEVHVDADKYPLRAAGMKPYKEIENKIKLVESTKVPGFDVDILGEIIPSSVVSSETIAKQYLASNEAIVATKKTASELKADIAKRLGKRMGDLDIPEWKMLRKEFGLKGVSDEGLVDALIHRWSMTSGDTDKYSIAMQLAAQKEFGLKGVSLWWDKTTLKQAQALFKTHEVPLKRFLREMYNDTQAYLKSKGLKSIRVVRGYGGDIGIGPSTMTNKMSKVGIELQPLSSFSSDFATAKSFAIPSFTERKALLFAEIPADRVLSCPITGFGCLSESEWVILGSQKAKEKMFGSMLEAGSKKPTIEGWEMLFGYDPEFKMNMIKEIAKMAK